jgi:hypothetical protein
VAEAAEEFNTEYAEFTEGIKERIDSHLGARRTAQGEAEEPPLHRECYHEFTELSSPIYNIKKRKEIRAGHGGHSVELGKSGGKTRLASIPITDALF